MNKGDEPAQEVKSHHNKDNKKMNNKKYILSMPDSKTGLEAKPMSSSPKSKETRVNNLWK